MTTTFTHGRLTVLKVATKDISGATKTSTFSGSADIHDVTGYGAAAHRKYGGLKDGKFTCGGTYDLQATTGTPTVLEGQEGSSFAIIRQVAGTATGKPQESFTGVLAKFDVTSPVDDMVTWSAEFEVDDVVNRTVQ
jgi:hypothetical protein